MLREENAYADPVNRLLFTVPTESLEEDHAELMCRVILKHGEDESREDRNMPAKNEVGSTKVEVFSVATKKVQMSIRTNDRLKFAEKMGNYQKVVRQRENRIVVRGRGIGKGWHALWPYSTLNARDNYFS
jgi:hypothetical protein